MDIEKLAEQFEKLAGKDITENSQHKTDLLNGIEFALKRVEGVAVFLMDGEGLTKHRCSILGQALNASTDGIKTALKN